MDPIEDYHAFGLPEASSHPPGWSKLPIPTGIDKDMRGKKIHSDINK